MKSDFIFQEAIGVQEDAEAAMGVVGSLVADLHPPSMERSPRKQSAAAAVPGALPLRRAPALTQEPAGPPADGHGSSEDDEADDLTQHQVLFRRPVVRSLEDVKAEELSKTIFSQK